MSKRIVKNIFENSENDKIAISSENNSKISYRDLKIFVEDISNCGILAKWTLSSTH